EDGIRDRNVTGVQTCALPIYPGQIRHQRAGGASFHHSVSRSYASAIRSIVASSKRRPVSCRPRGRRLDVNPHGTLTAGRPARLEIGRASCREEGEGAVGEGDV